MYKKILLLLLAFASHSPRIHVEGRTITKREVNVTTTTEKYDELTTAIAAAAATTETSADLQLSTILPESDAETKTKTALLTESNNGITLDISRFTSPNRNRSLFDELRAETSSPSFTSPFDSSSAEYSRLDLLNDSNESKSAELSIETAFKENERDFRNNATKEERHQIDEVRIDGKTIRYTARNQTLPLNNNNSNNNNNNVDVDGEEESDEMTTILPSAAGSGKKGKYLDLMPPSEDNINASLPNTAEVWALAAMREVDTRKPAEEEEEATINKDVELLNTNSNDTENTVKSLLDWTEIAKLDNDTNVDANNTKSTVHDVHDDPATAENKEVAVSSILPFSTATTSTTAKSIIDDDRKELDQHKNVNTSQPITSRIDKEIFAKESQEDDDSSFELIAPINNASGKKKENLIELTTIAATESTEKFTTPQPTTTMIMNEEEEATTMESVEPTTANNVDNFTIIGEDDESSDVFKRTITEMPALHTQELTTTSTRAFLPSTTATLPETTQIVTTTTSTEPTKKINQSTMITKSISIRIATTTTEQPIDIETTYGDSSEFLYSTSSIEHDNFDTTSTVGSYSSSPIEIIDDDKFKYNTLLPETSSTSTMKSFFDNSHSKNNFTPIAKDAESLNKESLDGGDSPNNVAIISVSVSIVVFLILAGAGFLLFKKRKKQLTYGQRCRPVGLDAYSLDNVSVYNSVRRKANALRLSKRSYRNSAFEDPSLQSNVLDYQSLQDFAKNKISIQDEFKEIPQINVRVEENPENCEDKNRYANVVPLPETRVHLQRLNDDEKTEYINANYVKGPKDSTNYYIATQAPLENTVADFWRMIWEQNSKVIIMLTDLNENGVERCAEYIPASVVLDNSQTFGDFQVTLKSREVKGKYAVSQLHLKNLKINTWREIMHLWYSWPENNCPADESSVIAMLLEARSYVRTSLPEHLDENSNAESNNNEKLSTLDKTKSLQRVQGPLTVHCSPGTGRTGTVIACDIVLRMLETPPRKIDIPQIVYNVRRGRANAVRTKDQYEFIYNIANSYATKLNVPTET